MIRQQQAQLQLMQLQAGHSTAVADDSTPTSERSLSFPNVPSSHSASITNARTRSPAPRSTSFELSHQSSRRSRTSSRTGSPALQPLSSGLLSHGEEWQLSGSGNPGTRDEIAFYQAETQTLTRENQMLRNRIRELGSRLENCLVLVDILADRSVTRARSQREQLDCCKYSSYAFQFDGPSA